jgi:tetratricopeptide (TPR) repeat protein
MSTRAGSHPSSVRESGAASARRPAACWAHALAVLASFAVATVGGTRSAGAHAESGSHVFAEPAVGGPFWEAMRLMNAELVAEAREHVVELENREPSSANALGARARLLFLEGDFGAAREKLDAARSRPDYNEKVWSWFSELLEQTWQTTRKLKPFPTSKGHFILMLEPGVDEVLIPYADAALEAAYLAYGEIFGYFPPEPVPVHVYGKVENLAAVSSLTVKQIQDSGTIALCKYNRLMITSPRDLIFGYDWLDTLAHEYIHYVIIKKSHNTVPIWIHEGLAKFFENRWKESTDAVMSPTSQDFLAKALEDNALIEFAAMSPSMAKLPTQEATALAFAEVFTVAQYLKEKRGIGAVKTLIELMRDGKSDKEAVAEVFGQPFEAFERDWRKYVAGLPLVRLPSSFTTALLFKNRDKSDDELDRLGAEESKKHTYLGDRLRVMKRFVAAQREYERAAEVSGSSSPVIQSKLASTLLELGKAKEALRAVLPALQFYPEYVLLHLYSGKAHLVLTDYPSAVASFERALQLNPFDPDAHEGLLVASEKLGRSDVVAREREALRILDADSQ